MTRVFYVDLFFSHSINLFESLLEISKNEKKFELKFLGPNQKIPSENSSLLKHVEKIWSNSHYVRKLYHYIKNQKPDLIHFTFEPNTFGPISSAFKFPILLFLIKMLKIRIVLTVRNIVVFKSDSGWVIPDYVPYKIPSSIMKILLKIFIKSICRFSDQVIVEANQSKLGLMEFYGIKENKIKVILYVGISKSKPLNLTTKEKLEKKFHGKKIILCFGVISPRKGQDTAIESLRIIHQKFPQYLLVIAGSVSNDFEAYEKRLHQVVRNYNLEQNVIFTGRIDYDEVDVLFDLAEASLFLYRQMSGSPSAVVYAIEHKTPCIVTKNQSFEEIFGKEGALYVDEDNEIQVAETIQNLSKDPNLKEQLRSKMKTISQELTWPNIARKHFELYNEMLMSLK